MTEYDETALREAAEEFLRQNLPRFHEMIDRHTSETLYGAEEADFLYTLACVYSKKCELLEEDNLRLRRAYETLEEECEATIFEMCEKFGK